MSCQAVSTTSPCTTTRTGDCLRRAAVRMHVCFVRGVRSMGCGRPKWPICLSALSCVTATHSQQFKYIPFSFLPKDEQLPIRVRVRLGPTAGALGVCRVVHSRCIDHSHSHTQIEIRVLGSSSETASERQSVIMVKPSTYMYYILQKSYHNLNTNT